MNRDMSLRRIEIKILAGAPGTIYVTSDFTDIASADTANRALQRLESKGVLRRIIRGVYERPEYSTFLQESVAPSPDKIARAIARNFGWTIAPSGDTALNILGLSTQVPAVWTYVSSGPYKEYCFDRVTLKFMHTANKDLAHISDKTALVIQALKTLGERRVSENLINRISSLFTIEEKQKMIREAKYSTAWIYDVIKEIALTEVIA